MSTERFAIPPDCEAWWDTETDLVIVHPKPDGGRHGAHVVIGGGNHELISRNPLTAQSKPCVRVRLARSHSRRAGGCVNVEQALREALAAHDAVIVIDPAKGYHFGTDPEIPEIAKSIAARLAPAAPAAPALDVETEIETPQWLWEAVHRALPRANIVCGGTHLMGYGTCQYIASGIAADVLARLANPEKP